MLTVALKETCSGLNDFSLLGRRHTVSAAAEVGIRAETNFHKDQSEPVQHYQVYFSDAPVEVFLQGFQAVAAQE